MREASIEERIGARKSASKSLTLPALGLLVVITASYLSHWGRDDGLDLRVYRAGIAAWRSGHNPYAGTFTTHHLHFTYPPFALLALSPLTWAPFVVTQIVLWLASIGALAGAVYVICRRCGRGGGRELLAQSFGWACLAVLVVEPVRSNLDYGQINTLLLCMVVVDLLVVSRRRSGWLIGLAAAIKLTPLIFLAIPLLERDWKTLSRGLAGALAATGLMWLFWPKVAMTYWRSDVFDARRVGGVAYVGNQSLYGVLHRWPFPSGGQTTIWLLLCVATLLMGLYVARRCLVESRRVAAMLALAVVGLLVSPISWTHHWVWVALIPPVLLSNQGQVPRSAKVALWLLFTVSVLAPYWWFTSGAAVDALGDFLSLVALALVVVWSWGEYRQATGAVLRALPRRAALACSVSDAKAKEPIRWSRDRDG